MADRLAMTGDDWRSDRDRRRQARAEAERKKKAMECARKLRAAADALNALMSACNECDDASAVRRGDDGRVLMVANISEYAGYLETVYER